VLKDSGALLAASIVLPALPVPTELIFSPLLLAFLPLLLALTALRVLRALPVLLTVLVVLKVSGLLLEHHHLAMLAPLDPTERMVSLRAVVSLKPPPALHVLLALSLLPLDR